MESNKSSSSINLINLIEIIYSTISISFNFDSILDIIDCYQSQCCQLDLSDKSGKIYTTGKHLFCSIPMHCILSRIFSGSNSSVKSICNSITIMGSINIYGYYHFPITRSYAALRAADLDWIVGPGYSPGG